MAATSHLRQGAGASPRYRRQPFTEAGNGFKTSEFYLTILAVAAVLLATYLDADSLTRSDGWRYAIFAVMAYVLSRGLAKLGSREPYSENE